MTTGTIPHTNTPHNPYYLSQRAWLDQLRLMVELAYPSWALMPAIGAIVRSHLPCAVMNFGWADFLTLHPLATWVYPLKPHVYEQFLANPQDIFDDVPIKAMRDSHGRFLQMIEASPGYEQAPIYKDMLQAYGARWGLSCPITTKQWLGFITLYRQAELGPYPEEDWQTLASAGEILSALDDHQHTQPSGDETAPPALREAVTASLCLTADGSMLAQSPATKNILFLARQTGMGPPLWARDDWHALPEAVTQAAQALFNHPEPFQQTTVSHQLPWGKFDFQLEKMQARHPTLKDVMNITIRHHEPLDIAIARKLWGWAMSPQEKRILIISARNNSQEQIAQNLNISVGTLKSYTNELLARFNAPTRQALMQAVLNSSDHP